ncbi:3-isopropylmalate dehydratase small subunit [Xenorhabdus thailandensis]|uniref:3-isopropylmalate dehydratase small subunit n=1 Tax=Xenorhabdus thailandensis TaxID=3136255 RepID=UPI0030F43DDB
MKENYQYVLENIRACLLNQNDVDTDAIIPQTELVTTTKVGLSKGLFARYRYDVKGMLNQDFFLNKKENKYANVLISGWNFGCGSSREHAVWALKDYGFMAIIALSFGEIFQRNSIRNGLITATMNEDDQLKLLKSVEPNSSGLLITLDLEKKTIEWSDPDGKVEKGIIKIDDGDRERIFSGQDEIDTTLTHLSDINLYLEKHLLSSPWIYHPQITSKKV